jgi:aryl-alcohol dehydrogenase-like predicted oxidoreductase
MATSKTTKKHFEQFPQLKSKVLGRTDLSVSICGFGTYRVSAGVNEHHSALEYALSRGINLIDTSSNYSDGASEELIGRVLFKMKKEKSLNRDEIVIVTKGGYLQGDNLSLALDREKKGNPYKEVTKCSEDLWHCINPEFLSDQISMSLRRLKCDRIDVYLLHNPEYFFECSEFKEQKVKEAEFYSRIRKAFDYLEQEVESGRISYYGVSSNSFGGKPADPNFVSLERLINIAGDISTNNHFAVIQFPLNLIEKQAAVIKNQADQTKTVLDFAAENDIGVLINRPLNAIEKNKLHRLKDYEITGLPSPGSAADSLKNFGGKEKELKKILLRNPNVSASEKRNLIDCLSVAKIIAENFKKMKTPEDFFEIRDYYLIPRANYAISLLVKLYSEEKEMLEKIKSYAAEANNLFLILQNNLGEKQNRINSGLHKELNEYLNEAGQAIPLSQKAFLMINSLPQVTSTLVGMRKRIYVDDVLNSIQMNYIKNASKYWRKE